MSLTTIAITAPPTDAADARLLHELAGQCEVFTVSASVMDAISPVRTPTGVVALTVPRASTLLHLLTPLPALVVLAVDVQDPGNSGAIVRSAEAGGATGVLFAGASADPWSWKALRAAMGSTFRLPVMRESSVQRACAQLRDAGLTLLATVPGDGRPIDEAELTESVAVILGSEGAGLSASLVASADDRVAIPMKPPVNSLNVAVAAGILVYEARRQRKMRSSRGV